MSSLAGVSANVYLSANPVFKKDLSDDISLHKWEAYKNITLVAITYIAFFAIAILAIWYAAFFAIEALPIVITLNAVGLNISHYLFSHPCKLKADEHFEAKAFEERVFKKIKTPNALTFAHSSEIGASQRGYNLERRLTPIFARYSVLHEESSSRLSEISRVFHQAAKHNSKGVPLNYQALKQNYQSRRLSPQQATWYLNHLATYKANKAKIQDEYLERRFHQIFLAYNASNPFRHKSYKATGACFTGGDLLARRYMNDDSFFLFNPKTHAITREELLEAHKEIARHILAERENRPDTYFSLADWDKINEIITRKDLNKRSRLSADTELAPFIEKAVNKRFIEVFSDYDAHSLRRSLSNFLLHGKYKKETLIPKGIQFTEAQLREASQIKEGLETRGLEKELEFHMHPRIKEIVEAKISAFRVL
jgi:hypothetical protein